MIDSYFRTIHQYSRHSYWGGGVEEGAWWGNWACGTGLELKGCRRKSGKSSWGDGLAILANAGPLRGAALLPPTGFTSRLWGFSDTHDGYLTDIKLMCHFGRMHIHKVGSFNQATQPRGGALFYVIGRLPVTCLCSMLYLCPTTSERSPPGTWCRAAGVHHRFHHSSLFLWTKNCNLKDIK